MADVSSTTGASSSRVIDTAPYRRDQPTPKGKSMPPATPKHPAAVARRNARERNRVRQVNMGFVTLRNHIPQGGSKSKKLSKVETLRQAANYIRYLRDMLTVDDSMNNAFSIPSSIACLNSGSNADGSNGFFFAGAPSPMGTSSEAYYANNPSPYSSNLFSDPANTPQQQKPSQYGILSSHLKISPSSSTDSPQSSSFVSSGSEHGNAYECVSPPELRPYQQGEYVDQNQHGMAPYHRLPPHCQPAVHAHTMPMYS